MDLTKIAELKEKYPEDADLLDTMYKSTQKSMIIADLLSHGGMQELLSMLKQMNELLNHKLLSDESLEKHERDLILTERRCFSWLNDTLMSHKNAVEGTEEFLNDK